MPLPNVIRHIHQLTDGYCLAACAEMALTGLGISGTQKKFAPILGVRPGIGTQFSNIRALSRYGIDIKVAIWQGSETLKQMLTVPSSFVVTAILTNAQLPGWGDLVTQHVVLLTTVDSLSVTYHDPYLPNGPVQAALDEFLLAWSDMDEMVAHLRRL